MLGKFFTITLSILALTSLSAWAAPPPLLVLDGKPNQLLPENFRIVPSLQAAGSGQFSKQQLVRIKNTITENIIDIDLRQESHGFVNGLPISWYAHRNWGNQGKTPHQIRHLQKNLLATLRSKKSVTVYQILKKSPEGQVINKKGVAIFVKTVRSEHSLTHSLHIGYQRFFLADHSPPTKQQARNFVRFVNSLSKKTWLYFHCRAGMGRTTTFLVMYDIIKKGHHTPLSTILKRQALVGGKKLRSLPPKNTYKYSLAAQRLTFIRWFYAKYHNKSP